MAVGNLLEEELLTRAKAKGYEHGVHCLEDTIVDAGTYNSKIPKDQIGVLERFERE